MHTQHPHVVLFDIDGTLLTVDSNFTRPLLRRILNDLNIFYPEMETDAFSGRTDFDILNSFLKNHNYDSKLYESLKHAYKTEFISLIEEKYIHKIPFTNQALQYFHSNGYYIGLLTGNFPDVAKAKLKAAGIDYDFKFGAYGEFHKNRNELPLIALEHIKTTFITSPKPENFIIIGDTTRDIECAKSAGMKSVAVATGKINYEMLKSHQPDLLLKTLENPQDWLPKLGI